MKPYPNTFEAFNQAFHALEAATIGKDSSAALKKALHTLGNAQDLYNEKADGFSESMHPSDITDQISCLEYCQAKIEGWTVTDVSEAEHLGTIETDSGESFEILNTGSKLVFGGACNAGFLESGFMLRSAFATLEDDLSNLNEDLNAYYHGKNHVSIYVNDRM
jgi:hypothetical protein